MASAGMGDALTGAILAFLAQGLPAYDASRLGAYAHGLAGDGHRSTLGQSVR